MYLQRDLCEQAYIILQERKKKALVVLELL